MTELALIDLEARVKKMRELGVVRWGDIELGPMMSSPDDDQHQDSAAQGSAEDGTRHRSRSTSRLVPRAQYP